MPNIKITAKHEPYRRCGMNHTRAGVVHVADKFTAKQLEQLRADPHLVVTEADPLAGASKANPIPAQVVLGETIAADKATASAKPAKAPTAAKAPKTTKAAKTAPKAAK